MASYDSEYQNNFTHRSNSAYQDNKSSKRTFANPLSYSKDFDPDRPAMTRQPFAHYSSKLMPTQLSPVQASIKPLKRSAAALTELPAQTDSNLNNLDVIAQNQARKKQAIVYPASQEATSTDATEATDTQGNGENSDEWMQGRILSPAETAAEIIEDIQQDPAKILEYVDWQNLQQLKNGTVEELTLKAGLSLPAATLKLIQAALQEEIRHNPTLYQKLQQLEQEEEEELEISTQETEVLQGSPKRLGLKNANLVMVDNTVLDAQKITELIETAIEPAATPMELTEHSAEHGSDLVPVAPESTIKILGIAIDRPQLLDDDSLVTQLQTAVLDILSLVPAKATEQEPEILEQLPPAEHPVVEPAAILPPFIAPEPQSQEIQGQQLATSSTVDAAPEMQIHIHTVVETLDPSLSPEACQRIMQQAEEHNQGVWQAVQGITAANTAKNISTSVYVDNQLQASLSTQLGVVQTTAVDTAAAAPAVTGPAVSNAPAVAAAPEHTCNAPSISRSTGLEL